SPYMSIISPSATVTIAFLYVEVLPVTKRPLEERVLDLPFTLMVFTDLTLTPYNCSTAFLISILLAFKSTSKAYLPWLFKPATFSVTMGLFSTLMIFQTIRFQFLAVQSL